ncbi:MAG: MFS transporter [Bacteroidales bacterium]|nr:MFS transporter [Bacteroidales bacterium]
MKPDMKISPWAWVPTLYFAEGIPYFMVNVISVIMFKRIGMGNGDVAMYTGLLYLPWVVKPLWSPFVDVIRTKRWWVIAAQLLMSLAFAAAAFSLPSPTGDMIKEGAVPVPMFAFTLVIFWITAFASATHDIAADGFYMLALDPGSQSMFVGIRSTFYRLSSIFGQGVLVVLAGILETRLGNIPLAWSLTIGSAAVLFGVMSVYHSYVMPHPSADSSRNGASMHGIIMESGRTFTTFFRKKGIVTAMLFMLLYRLPEAFLVKMLNPFLLDPVEKGGLGLATETVGIVYGTIGVAALTIGGILGGLASARWGLKKVLWPMALSLALPCLVFVYLSAFQPGNLIVINACVALDQFGYGFGFTAYMLYMMYFSDGEYRTSHYSLCTAFMALSMMVPGMVAGYLQEYLGYRGFFWLVIACCAATVGVTFFVKVSPDYGKKK